MFLSEHLLERRRLVFQGKKCGTEKLRMKFDKLVFNEIIKFKSRAIVN